MSNYVGLYTPDETCCSKKEDPIYIKPVEVDKCCATNVIQVGRESDWNKIARQTVPLQDQIIVYTDDKDVFSGFKIGNGNSTLDLLPFATIDDGCDCEALQEAITVNRASIVALETTAKSLSDNIASLVSADSELSKRIIQNENNIATLVGTDSGKSVATIANEVLVKALIPASAKESLDTLQEIAAWIQEHPDEAAAMNEQIASLQTQLGKFNVIAPKNVTTVPSSTGSNDIAIGNGAKSTASQAIAIGASAKADAANAVSVGYNSYAAGNSPTVAIGNGASVDGTIATAIGYSAYANDYAAAVGGSTKAASYSTAIGAGATATAADSVALGYASQATENYTVSVGNSSTKRRIVNVDDPTNAQDAATKNYVDEHVDEKVNNINVIAPKNVTAAPTANTTDAIAIGIGATAESWSTAIGAWAHAEADGSVAIGRDTNQHGTGEGSVSIGNGAEATGDGAAAVGADSYSGYAESVALGHNSQTDAEYTVSVGNDSLYRRITNVADPTGTHDAVTKGYADACAEFTIEAANWSTNKQMVGEWDSYYTYVISATILYEPVTIGIVGLHDGPPSGSEEEAYNCVKYAVTDMTAGTITLCATSKPTDNFAIQVKGVK